MDKGKAKNYSDGSDDSGNITVNNNVGDGDSDSSDNSNSNNSSKARGCVGR